MDESNTHFQLFVHVQYWHFLLLLKELLIQQMGKKKDKRKLFPQNFFVDSSFSIESFKAERL